MLKAGQCDLSAKSPYRQIVLKYSWKLIYIQEETLLRYKPGALKSDVRKLIFKLAHMNKVKSYLANMSQCPVGTEPGVLYHLLLQVIKVRVRVIKYRQFVPLTFLNDMTQQVYNGHPETSKLLINYPHLNKCGLGASPATQHVHQHTAVVTWITTPLNSTDT